MEEYDIIIIGSGPAGMAASIYSARYKLKTLVISKCYGGLAATASMIHNWPGTIEITGTELMNSMKEQAEKLGVVVKCAMVDQVNKQEDGTFEIRDLNNETYKAKKVILALGTEKRKPDIENLEKFEGKGVSYCATCDAPMFTDKTVGVIGGGNSALTSALLLAKYAKKIYVIYRKPEFNRPDHEWVNQVEQHEKIETKFNTNVKKVDGKVMLEKVQLDPEEELELQGLFIATGSVPSSALVNQLGVEMDEKGYIKTDKDMKTNVKGIFAAGDITDNSLKQMVVAAGEGATAAFVAKMQISKGE